MFPWLELCRSANESVDDSDALAGESTEATSPAPDSGQETSEENTQSVPYDRFKGVNDKLADALRKIAEMETGEPATPDPAPQAPIDAKAMKTMMKDALKDLGFAGVANEVKQLRVEQKRDQLLTELGKFSQFDRERDVPRIKAKMEAAKAAGEKIGAINAFKLLLGEGPPEKAATAHDAQGTTTGEDKPKKGFEPQGMPALRREQAVTAQFKRMFEKDPAMRKALELD